MKYTVDDIINKYEWEENLNYIFFWGHTNPSEKINHTCLSQWYEAPFTVEDIEYKTTEHWMMSQKALLFKDREILDKIIHAETPAEAKKLGREIRNFDDTLWNEHKYTIVYKGNYYKFSQNPELYQYLKSTSGSILVEASPLDKIWGIGMAEGDRDITNPNKWKGINLLGFAIMEVRDILIEEEEIREKNKLYTEGKKKLIFELSLIKDAAIALFTFIINISLLIGSVIIAGFFAWIFGCEYDHVEGSNQIFKGEYTDIIVLFSGVAVFRFIIKKFERLRKFLKKQK